MESYMHFIWFTDIRDLISMQIMQIRLTFFTSSVFYQVKNKHSKPELLDSDQQLSVLLLQVHPELRVCAFSAFEYSLKIFYRKYERTSS